MPDGTEPTRDWNDALDGLMQRFRSEAGSAIYASNPQRAPTMVRMIFEKSVRKV